MRGTSPGLACSILLTLAAWPASAEQAVLSFEDAVARALTANNQLLAQEYRTDQVELDYAAARAELQPRVSSFVNSDARSGSDIGSQYGVVMDRQFSSGANFGVGYYDSSFGGRSLSELRFNYTLPFFSSRGEEIQRSLDDASFALSQESARLRLTRLEVEREVLRNYYDVVLARTSLELARTGEAIAASGAEAIRIRRDGGQASALDVRRADMAAAEAGHRARQAGQALEAARDRLRLTIGAEPADAFVVDAAAPPGLDLNLLDLPVEALLERAAGQRLEVIEAGRALAAAERRMHTDRSRALPDIEVSLQYALVDETGLAGRSLNDQRFGIGVRMNTDFRRQAEQRAETRQLLEVRERERAYAYVKQTVAMDVKRAHGQAADILSQLALARQALELADEELARARIMAERGAIDQLGLLGLEQQQNEARHQIRALEVAHSAALYDLQLAAGGRLQ